MQNAVLLAQEIGASNTFLPGGHIERGENAMDALEREVQEEIGVSATTREFLGAVEHMYPDTNPQHHELNLVFTFSSDALTDPTVAPESQESHLRFFWCDMSQLHQQNLLPPPMIDVLQEVPLTWASTISRNPGPKEIS